MRFGLLSVPIAGVLCFGAPAAAEVDLKGPIAIIRQVGPNGQGSQAAARAWEELAQADVRQLPQLLAGMDGANSLACNWLRAAIDQVLEQADAHKQPLPIAGLEELLRDTRHHPQARRLAYELIVARDKAAPERWLPGMLDDPSLELRRDAVARLLEQAEKTLAAGKKTDALPLFRQALAAARDKDQLDKAAKHLGELGHPVDLATHLGMVMDWKLIGPFPNPERKGVETVYAPEKKLDFAAEVDGLKGKIRWKDHVVTKESGLVDLNTALEAVKDGVAYATTEFTSKDEQSVDIRLGCWNVFKLWVNGELVLERGDEFTGMRFDHYVARVHLKPGKNVLLLKVCKNDHQFPIPKDWRFQLRVCDASGAAILSTTRPAPVEKKP